MIAYLFPMNRPLPWEDQDLEEILGDSRDFKFSDSSNLVLGDWCERVTDCPVPFNCQGYCSDHILHYLKECS